MLRGEEVLSKHEPSKFSVKIRSTLKKDGYANVLDTSLFVLGLWRARTLLTFIDDESDFLIYLNLCGVIRDRVALIFTVGDIDTVQIRSMAKKFRVRMRIEELKIPIKHRSHIICYYRILIGGSRLYLIRISGYDAFVLNAIKDFLIFAVRLYLNSLSSLAHVIILLFVNVNVRTKCKQGNNVPPGVVVRKIFRIIKLAIPYSELELSYCEFVSLLSAAICSYPDDVMCLLPMCVGTDEASGVWFFKKVWDLFRKERSA